MGHFGRASRHAANYATFGGADEQKTRSISSHRNAPWFSRLVFAYAWPLLRIGATTQLDLDDLWELDGDIVTATAYRGFARVYEATSKDLKRAVIIFCGPHLVFCGFLSFVTEICAVFAPIVLHQVIDLFSAPTIDMKKLLAWVAAFFVSRLVNGFAYTHAKFQLELVQLRLTSALKALLFNKAMRRSLRSHHATSAGAHNVEVSNLFTADIDSLMSAGSQINALWIMPIQITVVLALLYYVLDIAAMAGLAVIVASMAINSLVAKRYNAAFKQIMRFKDERMKAVKEVFGAIQVVKLNAWERQTLDRLQRIRMKEAAVIARYLYWNGLSIFFFWSAPLWVSVASFTVYSLVLGNKLTVAKIFTSMVLFNAIREPLSQLPDAIQSLMQARTALARMATYLAAEEYEHTTVSRDPAKHASTVEVAVKNVSIKWQSLGTKPVLADVSFTIRQGDFVVIHGPVGSGKSTLCAALLGEVPLLKGEVFMRSSSVAYCAQQPWIQNMTIRDNSLFGLAYNKAKYDKVIDACGLSKDLTMLPAGDMTEIGQKGVNLSGGQKARVSLARACYSDADVLILDSPLAAVDAVVQREIFNKCLCGLLASKTVILVTHSREIIHSAVANVIVQVETVLFQSPLPRPASLDKILPNVGCLPSLEAMPRSRMGM